MTSAPARIPNLPALILAMACCSCLPMAAVAGGDDAAASAAVGAPQPLLEPAQADELFASRVAPFVKKYCVECHGSVAQESGLNLEMALSGARVDQDCRLWEKVVNKLRADAMPPEDHEPRPSVDQRKEVLSQLHATLFEIDCTAARDPGRVTIRRLNRAEYFNTIRDLVGIEFHEVSEFPSDDVGYGFDNIGDVLSLPPLLMEKYLDAAEKIAARAIVLEDPAQHMVRRYAGSLLDSSLRKPADSDGIFHLNSNGEVFVDVDFPVAGNYVIRVHAAAQQAGPDPARMELRIAGQNIASHDIKDDRKLETYEARIPVQADGKFAPGVQRVAAAFLNDYYDPKNEDPQKRDRNLHVAWIEVEGPFDASGPVHYPESHTRIIFVTPGPDKNADRCVREILTRFASCAFRRPVVEEDIAGILKLAQVALADGERFERAIQLGVQAILVSPRFLFRLESDPERRDPEQAQTIEEYALATRLSYFLWSSMPDEALFALAAQRELHKSEVLAAQVKRMLDDPKSKALVENFAGQWLNLRLLDEATPNPRIFPDFDVSLRRDMRRETELFFETVLRENKSILEFIDGEYTFVNERLATLYGVPDIKGDEFRRVSLTGGQRAGVLTQPSILTLTSDPARTLPVKRGKWILENILGTPPPPPPANVPDLAITQQKHPAASLSEQLKLHRTRASCAICHQVMDPLGLAFENFDAIGRWRDKDGERPIDVKGQLVSGESFSTPRELVSLLRKREDEFTRHLARTMLTYALGRGLEYYDGCTVDTIAAAVRQNDYRFQTLVVEIVKSEPFQKRRGDGGNK